MWFFTSQYFRESILNDIRKARNLFTGKELAAELARIRQRVDNIEVLTADIVINLLLSYRDIQVRRCSKCVLGSLLGEEGMLVLDFSQLIGNPRAAWSQLITFHRVISWCVEETHTWELPGIMTYSYLLLNCSDTQLMEAQFSAVSLGHTCQSANESFVLAKSRHSYCFLNVSFTAWNYAAENWQFQEQERCNWFSVK